MRLIWANEVKQKLYTTRSKYLANIKVKRAVEDLLDKCETIEAKPVHHKEGGNVMTNREWIESLTDEEWERWLDEEHKG